MYVARLLAEGDDQESKKAKKGASPVLGFSDEDKIRTTQPHNDALVVDAYSPYTAIVARPWLHALRTVSSTLHQKVKYLSEGQVKEIVGN